MFDNLKGLAGLMGNAGQIRERMEKVQQELEHKTVEGNAGAGAVRVTMNGKLDVVRVELDPVMIQTLAAPTPTGDEPAEGEATTSVVGVSDDDRRMVEDLITAAMNDAITKARELVQQEIHKASEGLNIPGLENMLKQFNP